MSVSTQPGRYEAYKLAKRFLRRQSYQPPVECSHSRPSLVFHQIRGVKGDFQACRDCGLTLGFMGVAVSYSESPPAPVSLLALGPAAPWSARIASWARSLRLIRWWRRTF